MPPPDGLGPEAIADLYRLAIANEFRQQVFNLIIAANLCRLGSIAVEGSRISQDGRKSQYEPSVVTSKPANGKSPGPCCFTPFLEGPTSLKRAENPLEMLFRGFLASEFLGEPID